MTPRMTKSDAMNLNDKVIDLSPFFEAQYLLKFADRVGYNAGNLGWNYDVYDVNGITILYGDRTPDFRERNFSSEILKKLASQAENLRFTTPEYQKKGESLLKEFTDSVHAGIKDPSPIKNWNQFKKQLIAQVDMERLILDMSPEKDKQVDFLKVAAKLTNFISSDEIKDKINSKLKTETVNNKRDKNVFYARDKNEKDELNTTLFLVYREEKDRHIKRSEEKREKAYELER